MFGLFKKKKKIETHDLRDIDSLQQYYLSYRGFKCTKCNRQFVMDMLGGWGEEWNFKTETTSWNGVRVDSDDLKSAVDFSRSKSLRDWYQVDQAECSGKE